MSKLHEPEAAWALGLEPEHPSTMKIALRLKPLEVTDLIFHFHECRFATYGPCATYGDLPKSILCFPGDVEHLPE